MRSYQRKHKMKKLILTTALLLGVLQAEDVVYYDIKDAKTQIDKPNHPSTDIYKNI